jgi:hypothetical protein
MRIPTLDEILFHAGKIGLVPIEAEKFFYHYESNGWMVGKNPMKSWTAAMQNWKLRCQSQPASAGIKPVDKMIMFKELEEISRQMGSIRGSYDSHQNWSQKDRDRYKFLRTRQSELRQILGVKI